MCVHLWARAVQTDGHVLYICTRPDCTAVVDWTASREQWDRMEHTSPTAPIPFVGKKVAS